MNKLRNIEGITANSNKEKHPIFGYTPMCGTCKISERTLDIADRILQLPIKKIDLNFYPEWSKEKQIMSAPVLLLMRREEEIKRVYAFQLATYLLENLK